MNRSLRMHTTAAVLAGATAFLPATARTASGPGVRALCFHAQPGETQSVRQKRFAGGTGSEQITGKRRNLLARSQQQLTIKISYEKHM